MHRGDPLPPDGLEEIPRFPVLARGGDHQARTEEQWPEKLPYGHVKAVGRFLQHPVRRLKSIGSLHPEEPVDQPQMGVRRALGAPGGAGGVDDIGGVLGPEGGGAVRVRGVVRGRSGQRSLGLGGIQGEKLELLRQPRTHAAAGEHQDGGRLGQHLRQPRRGILGIERQVSAPGLERREQARPPSLGSAPARCPPPAPAPPRGRGANARADWRAH